ncbi:MAG: hypothetical protein ABL951_12670 [Alphaproteobacteria bacterium]
MADYDITTDDGVVNFAQIFIERRLKGFKKDIAICLRPDENNSHAYMPGLMACFSLLDFFSSLYAGQMRGHSHEQLIKYMRAFAPPDRYDDYLLKVAYIAFRHKLAHLSHPYFVLNTQKDCRINERQMLLTWTISEEAHDPPIKLCPLKRPKKITRHPTPWPLFYDHRIYISIRTLADDIMDTAPKYLAELKESKELKKNFRTCMCEFYQTKISTSA